MKIGEAIYKAQAAGAQPGAGTEAGPQPGGAEAPKPEDKVVDAEYEEVDETKKRGQG
jgi:molecular chaperone DnaK